MTDKEIEKLAEEMATRVMQKLVEKQQEWDADFEVQIEKYSGRKVTLEEEIDALRNIRLDYIAAEKYELVPQINDQIEAMQKRLNDR
jgi:protein-arginine kinase activator protein McsA|tara:strand:+ start:306 stop:566 length:261 start_codon:yes stop_codon:yes gene_type:complete